ncbi:hypothetical protein JTB14_004020 [Gonioctena quinquepunctata]|nr:hypothetical protein JTB14_004020 [Gonioctena quinquepunctata]
MERNKILQLTNEYLSMEIYCITGQPFDSDEQSFEESPKSRRTERTPKHRYPGQPFASDEQSFEESQLETKKRDTDVRTPKGNVRKSKRIERTPTHRFTGKFAKCKSIIFTNAEPHNEKSPVSIRTVHCH